MSEKVDPKIIKKTQDSLGKIIKKPPLTEKLLNKPPFRFLHDILTSVIKTTGFMKDVFTDMEMSSDNIKDKESKILFLQKAIDFITFVNGSSISTNPNKVIAGHEASKTNEFLQALADAVNKKNTELKICERRVNQRKPADKPAEKPTSKNRIIAEETAPTPDKKSSGQSPRKSSKQDTKSSIPTAKVEKSPKGKQSYKPPIRKSGNHLIPEDGEADHSVNKSTKKVAVDKSKVIKKTRPEKDAILDISSPIKAEKRGKVNNEEYVQKFQKKSDKSKSTKKERPPRESSASTKISSDKEKDAQKEEKRGRKGGRDRDGKREDKENKREDKDRRRDDGDRERDSRKERKREEREEGSTDRRDKSRKRNEEKEHRSRDDRRVSKDRGDDRRRSSKDHRSTRNDSEKRSNRDHDSRKSARPRRHHNEDDNDISDDEFTSQKERRRNEHKDTGLHTADDNEAKLAETTDTDKHDANLNNNNNNNISEASKEEFHRQAQNLEKATDDNKTPEQSANNKGRLARPSSARPAPPKPKQQDDLNRSQNKPPMSEINKVQNLIVDKQLDTDSDSDEGLIDDHDYVDDLQKVDPHNNDLAAGEHGGLVKGILEQKNTLEQGNLLVKSTKTQIEKTSSFNDVARNKERQIVEKQISSLRSNIQTLTRGVNPLGKIMDFVQEDLDAMRKELDVWKAENRSNEHKLMMEKSITETSIEPLQQQLIQLDASISDEHDIIAAVKSNIIRNNERIAKMIATIAVS